MKVLLFYPHNPFELMRGVDVKFFYLIKSLKKIGCKIDLFTLKNFESKWDNMESYYYEFVDNIFLFDHKITIRENRERTNPSFMPNGVTKSMKLFLRDILKEHKYSHLIVSYIIWADLADEVPAETDKIIMIEDFISMNHLGRRIITEEKFPFALKEEIERMRKFNKSAFVSIDEMFFFSPLIGETKSYFIPTSVPERVVNKELKGREYDLFFIGYDNPFNVEGIKWFFERIYPKLSKKLKILVVGKVTNHIGDYENVKKISYVENLSEVYSNVRLSIVPLLSGTGIKIKVIEAMSFGIPVITTLYGVTGLINKTENGCLVADNENEFTSFIEELLTDEKKYFGVRNKGIENFRKYYSLKKFDSNIKKLMED